MKSMGQALRSWRFWVLACVVLAPLVHAQMGGSGTDVMDVFRSMSPDQQQQVMQQLGMGGQGFGGTSTGTSGVPSQQQALQQDLDAMRYRQYLQQRAELEERLPVLRPEDWIVVEVDTVPLLPRPTDTSEALYRSLIYGTPTGVYPYTGSTLYGGNSTSLLGSPAALGQFSGAPVSPQVASQLSPTQLQQYQLLMQQQQQQQSQPQAGGQAGTEQQSQAAGQSAGQVNPAPTGGWQFGPPGLMAPRDIQDLSRMVALIRSKNPYQLTSEGVLNLPGFTGIHLAGLSDVQATLRLEVEPELRGLHFRVTKLTLTKSGVASLKPFGYDLFENPPSTFAPVTNVPVPADYVIGTGDVLQVQLYGNQRDRFLTLQVGNDGRVNLPEIGPVSVAGQRFLDVKQDIEKRVASQMIGVKASVSMGETRTIRIFVLGEARESGTYAVSGFATITSALYAAGGVKTIGSLRDVQLKRDGKIVRHLDLYDLLIRGDTTDDAKLLPGDAVFVPPVGPTASVEGEVHRPAIYEIKHETTLGDLVGLAGGLTNDAEPTAWLTRIDARGLRTVLRVDLSSVSGRSQPLHDGDQLRVTQLIPTLDSGVTLQGHVYTPGPVAFRQGMTLTDVIGSVDELRPNADLHYVLIRRELPPDRRVEVFSADLGAALAAPRGSADIPLMPRDRVIVFDLGSGRDRIIQPLLEELRLQSHFDRPTEVVQVQGRVKVPGEYPLEPGMRVSDLLRAGGDLTDAAYGGQAELARYAVVNGEERQIQLIPIDLNAVLRGDPKANISLEPFDTLSIKQLSFWGEQSQVTLLGQVRFPGIYTIREGETLKSVLQRAGGLTVYAFPEGSVFTRVELKQREQQQLDMLAQRTQADITAMALEAVAGSAINGGGGSAGGNALTIGQGLLAQLRATKAVGRLVIDLPRLLREPSDSQDDVILRSGDQLIVPRYQQEVTVIGEVQSNTSLLYRSNLTRDDYINLSGGMTQHADAGKIYIVRANGSVVPGRSAHFFRVGSSGVTIRPGDTIVVPMNTQQLPPLPEWQAITGIIYNLAIGAAAIHAVGV